MFSPDSNDSKSESKAETSLFGALPKVVSRAWNMSPDQKAAAGVFGMAEGTVVFAGNEQLATREMANAGELSAVVQKLQRTNALAAAPTDVGTGPGERSRNGLSR